MRPSRGMGDMMKSKMSKGGGATVYAKGGKTGKKLDIAKAIKKPGALRKQLGAPKGKKIPVDKLAKATKAPGKLGQRARFAQMLKG